MVAFKEMLFDSCLIRTCQRIEPVVTEDRNVNGIRAFLGTILVSIVHVKPPYSRAVGVSPDGESPVRWLLKRRENRQHQLRSARRRTSSRLWTVRAPSNSARSE